MVTWDSLDALSHVLELNGVGPTSTVVALIGDDETLAPLVRAALARSRAEAIELRPSRLETADLERLANGTLLPAVLNEADVVVDALPGNGLGAIEIPGRLVRLDPAAANAHERPLHANLAVRVDDVSDVLARGRQLLVSDEHGTELVVDLGDVRISGDAGRTFGDGTRTTFPSGWAHVVPGSSTVDGDIVLMPGDANVSRGIHVSSPVRLTMQRGRLTAIEGESADADVLRALFEALDHDDAYGIAGVGLGLNPGRRLGRAPFDPMLLDPNLARLTAGVVQLEFGDNPHAGRPCDGRVILALARRTLHVDEMCLCDQGELLGAAAPDIYELPG